MTQPIIKTNPNVIDLDEAYLRMAEIWALRSKANRLQVGALIVKDRQIISDGYNGMPEGMDNVCEHYVEQSVLVPPIGFPEGTKITDLHIKTRPEVLHAEANAITKLAKLGGNGAQGATLYCTHAPCIECAKLILQAGIKRVVYRHSFRTLEGLKLLQKANVLTSQG